MTIEQLLGFKPYLSELQSFSVDSVARPDTDPSIKYAVGCADLIWLLGLPHHSGESVTWTKMPATEAVKLSEKTKNFLSVDDQNEDLKLSLTQDVQEGLAIASLRLDDKRIIFSIYKIDYRFTGEFQTKVNDGWKTLSRNFGEGSSEDLVTILDFGRRVAQAQIEGPVPRA